MNFIKNRFLKAKSLKASFTIESAFIFPIFFFAISYIIGTAWIERNYVLTGYALSQTVERASRREVVYAPDSPDDGTLAAELRERLSSVGALTDPELSVSSGIIRTEGDLAGQHYSHHTERLKNDPERIMRISTAAADFISHRKDIGGSNDAANSE